MAAIEHIDSTGVAEAVNGIDGFQAFLGQSHSEVFVAEAIDAVPGKFLSTLIDKQTLLIRGLWPNAVFFDIELEELTGFGLKRYEPVAISLPQNGQGFLLRVEVVDVQGCDFTGPGP